MSELPPASSPEGTPPGPLVPVRPPVRRRLPPDGTQYFELLKIIPGFILTGVVGTAFSQWHTKTGIEQAAYTSFRARAIEVHDGIATLAWQATAYLSSFLTALTESKE